MRAKIDPRERAVEAARLLSYFMVDLIVGTRGLEIFDKPAIALHVTANMTVGMNRMALSHLVVTLAKWAEFYRRYATILLWQRLLGGQRPSLAHYVTGMAPMDGATAVGGRSCCLSSRSREGSDWTHQMSRRQ